MAFASVEDVASRLGRELTDNETQTVEMVLDSVSGLAAEAAGEAADWSPEPVPATIKLLCVEKAVSVLANPEGYASVSEQLGSYQHTGTFPRAADIGVFLSDDERRRVRRAAGKVQRSVTLQSPFSGASDDDHNLDFSEFDS